MRPKWSETRRRGVCAATLITKAPKWGNPGEYGKEVRSFAGNRKRGINRRERKERRERETAKYAKYAK